MLIAAVITLGSITAAVLRLREIDRLERDALEATVEAEALALRIGDRAAFMNLQVRSGAWQTNQHRNFSAYQTFQPRIEVTGDLIDMQIADDEARVVVGMHAGEQPIQAVWLYTLTPFGWRHAATISEPWSEQFLHSEGVTITYQSVDDHLAQSLHTEISQWWAQAAPTTGLPPMPLTVELAPEARQMYWKNSDDPHLIIPARDADGNFLDALPPQVDYQLADILAERWTDYALGPDLFVSDRWAVVQTYQWFRAAFEPETNTAPLLTPLSRAFMPGLTATFFATVRTSDAQAAIALRDSMAHHAPGRLEGAALNEYLADFLRAEIAFTRQPPGRFVGYSRGQTLSIFFDLSASVTPPPDSMTLYDLEDISVASTRREGETLWVEVRGSIPPRRFSDSGDAQPAAMRVPFHFVNGYWQHAALP